MTIILNPEQEQFIQEKLKTGQYDSAEAIISEALQLLEARDKHYQKWVEETRKKVAVGIAQLERGEGIDGEQVFKELLEKLESARKLEK